MTKLPKDIEKRFDEKFGVVELEGVEVFVEYVKDDDGNIIGSDLPEIKQHLADELERQKKEIIEEMNKWWDGEGYWTCSANEAVEEVLKELTKQLRK